MANNKCFITIEKGEPYDSGTEIIMVPGSIVLGRPWKEHQPDLQFLDPHISKQHLELTMKDGLVTLTDLDSKHGTQINGADVVPRKLYALKNNDLISMARGTVLFRLAVSFQSQIEHTVDLESGFIFLESFPELKKGPIAIDRKKREVFVEGNKIELFGKEIELLLTLYEKVNQATSLEEIKYRVWPERSIDPVSNVPDVGPDEINSLVYRLRKRLKKHGDSIVTIPRYGYRLDIDQ